MNRRESLLAFRRSLFASVARRALRLQPQSLPRSSLLDSLFGFFLFASARRRVGSTIERYSWKIRSNEIDASGDVMLTNDNLVMGKGIAEGAKNNRGADALGVEADKTQKKLDVPIPGVIRNQEDEPEAVGAGVVKSSETSRPNPMALPRPLVNAISVTPPAARPVSETGS